MKVFDEYLQNYVPEEDRESARGEIKRFMESLVGQAIQLGLRDGLRAEIANQRSFMDSLYAPQSQAEAQICEGRIQVLETFADGLLGFSRKA